MIKLILWLPILLFILRCEKSGVEKTAAISVTTEGAALTPASAITFGIIPADFEVQPLSFTVSNTGEGSLFVTGVKITGTDSTSFNLVDSLSSFVIKKNESSNFTIRYKPTSAGAKEAALALVNNDPSTPAFVLVLKGDTSWGTKFVDGNSTNGINKDTSKSATGPSMAELSDKLYAAWSEDDGSATQIRVAVYNTNDDSPSWSFVDGNGSTGLNKSTSRGAASPTLVTFNSKIYLAWHETDGSANQIRVAVYNGDDSSPSWSFVDGNGSTGLNKNPSLAATVPQLAVFSNKLYLTWMETDGSATQIRLKVYGGDDDSPSWTAVDGNASTGINKDTTKNAQDPYLATFEERLYATWAETDGSANQIRVAVYNGTDSVPSWAFVDGNAATGLNKDTTKAASTPRLLVYNQKLYLTWSETDGTATQIRSSVYNSTDSNPVWATVDGDAATGLNKDTTKNATNPRPLYFRNNLYLIWSETDGTATQVRIKVYNGNDSSPQWSFSDGDETTGINKDSAKAAANPVLISFSKKLYAMWIETSTADQVRVAVGNQ